MGRCTWVTSRLAGLVVVGLTPGPVHAAHARPLVCVQNGSHVQFQRVVESELPTASLRPRAAYTATEVGESDTAGAVLPCQVDPVPGKPGRAVLSLLMPGRTEPGQRRVFRVARAAAPDTGPRYSDLYVDASDGRVVVGNTYFAVTHPTRGGGGFPRTIRFAATGHVDRGLTFEDRLYHRQRGYFALRSDATARARVVARGPWRVTIETIARYHAPGAFKDAPPSPVATYRWVYHAHSPVIEVQAHIQRTDDLVWPEHHVLQMGRKDQHYSQWVGGEPLKQGKLVRSGKSFHFKRWAVLGNAHDAFGVAGPNGVLLWDDDEGFFRFLRAWGGPWKSRTFDITGRLYLGPAAGVADLRACLADPGPTVTMATKRPSAKAPGATSVRPARVIENSKLRLGFASDQAGMGLVELTSKVVHKQLLRGVSAPARLWEIELRRGHTDSVTVCNTTPSRRAAKRTRTGGGQTLELQWRGVDLPGEKGALDVTVAVRLADNDPLSYWTIDVDNRSMRLGLWEVHFPLVAAPLDIGTSDIIRPNGNFGLRIERAKGPVRGTYPSGGWPLQMLCVDEAGGGVYVATHDPGAWAKKFFIAPAGDLRITTWPENMGVPGSDLHKPFPAVIGVYKGNWLAGAKIYRRWVVRAPWTSRGPMVKRRKQLAPMERIGIWFLEGGAGDRIVREMERMAKTFRVPIGIHWYHWHQIPFDHSYPEYFPTKPGFAQAVQRLVKQNMAIMPYINGRLWDSEIPSFKRALPWACKKPDGTNYIEIYGSKRKLSPMCPATPFWQQKVREICKRLVFGCGVNAIYLDQIAAAGPCACFDPKHGHPLGGGRWWVDGYRRMLSAVRKEVDRAPQGLFLTSENTAEPYMDHIDGLLTWGERTDQAVPLLPAVYSGYVVYFSSPCGPQNTDRAFAMLQGRDFLWGCQVGWNAFWMGDPKRPKRVAFMKRLGQYRRAAIDALMYGEYLGTIEPVETVPLITDFWHRRKKHRAALPAVMTAVWQSSAGRLMLLFVNADMQAHAFRYRFDPAALGRKPGPGGWLVSRIEPDVALPVDVQPASGIDRTERLAPFELRVLSIGPADAPAKMLVGAQHAVPLPARKRGTETSDLAEQARTLCARLACREAGLDVTVDPPLRRVVPGRPYLFEVTVRNRSGRDQTLTWHPGRGRSTWTGALPVPAGKRATILTVLPDVGEADRSDVELGRLVFRSHDREWSLPVRVSLTVVAPLEVRVDLPPELRAGETATLRVHVRNNRSRTVRPTLTIDAPDTWTFRPGRRLAVPPLGPGHAYVAVVACHPGLASAPGPHDLGVTVIESTTRMPVVVAAPRPRAACVRFAKAPDIDGKLGEWPTEPSLTLGPGPGVKIAKYGGPADLSGRVWLGWDATHFYVGARVIDNRHEQRHNGFQMWSGDCIQLAWRAGRPMRRRGFDGLVHEVGLTVSPTGPLLFKWIPRDYPITDGRIRVVRSGRELVYEGAIPWRHVGTFRPSVGRPMTFSITLNDADGTGFRGWIEWTPGICGGKDASAFGWLDLLDAPAR